MVHRSLLPPRPERLRELLRPRPEGRARPSSSVTPAAGEISVDRGYYHAGDTVTLQGSGFPADETVTITISDPTGRLRRARSRCSPTASARSRPSSSPIRTATSARSVVAADDRRRPGHDELPGRPRRRPDLGPAHRRRPAHLPARPDHRPGLRDLPRRLGERHRRQGHADEPRLPGLRGRPVDPAAADRQQRPAEPRHAGRRRSGRTVRAASPPASRRRRSPAARARRGRAS